MDHRNCVDYRVSNADRPDCFMAAKALEHRLDMGNEKRDQTDAIREATGAFCRALLDAILPSIRIAARHHGYAVAVHGSLKRDIDLVAIAWREHNVSTADELVKAICGAISGVTGNCLRHSDCSQKPHGRVAYTLIHNGFIGEIDLSVIPPVPKQDEKS